MSDLRGVTQGLPEKINITDSGGVSGGVFKTQEDIESNRILTGKSFLSTCSLPDVQKNTRILGICGITDWNQDNDPKINGRAHPKKDGWFFSDFYLFHHLLKDVSSDQIWMTSVDPEYAVDKYGEYIHGDSSPGKIGTRRVVLDRSMLSEVKKDLRVVPPKELCDRALSTITDVCRKATDEKRPLLILIFGHGIQFTHAIAVGGKSPYKPDEITIAKFKQAIGSRVPEAGLCLLTTACYSGGWSINANLKFTTMTAQADWTESLAWPVSGTIHQRSCGSPFATAIADMLLRLTIRGYHTDDLDDFQKAPSYAGFISLIRDSIQKKDPRNYSTTADGDGYSVHQPMFSAQDDEWEMAYSDRTGFPLNKFHERWRLLKKAGPRQEPPGGEHRFGPGSRAFSHDELMTTVKSDGEAYLGSFPGIDSSAKNMVLHNELRSLIQGTEIPSVVQLGFLRDQIDYRLNHIMRTATTYKKVWGLDLPNCEEVDVGKGPGIGSPRWRELLGLVQSYPLFDAPQEDQGYEYGKGEWYLASCIFHQKWNMTQAEEKLNSLVRFREPKVPRSGVPNIEGTSRVMGAVDKFELNRDKVLRHTIRKYTEGTKRRMRSMSPRKSRRKTLPSDWTQENDTSDFGKLSLGGGPSSAGLGSPIAAGLGSPGRGAGLGSPGRGGGNLGGAGLGSPGPSRGGGGSGSGRGRGGRGGRGAGPSSQ
ncbi:hypothetical protein V500_10833 [Pseudogymnoascus sp. VKM F-4518 (FW-2643)]|nr:hypothetical protein V500_10833 [Pseudogymnoascus sp. VKM F-4518 (FW-2643)]